MKEIQHWSICDMRSDLPASFNAAAPCWIHAKDLKTLFDRCAKLEAENAELRRMILEDASD